MGTRFGIVAFGMGACIRGWCRQLFIMQCWILLKLGLTLFIRYWRYTGLHYDSLAGKRVVIGVSHKICAGWAASTAFAQTGFFFQIRLSAEFCYAKLLQIACLVPDINQGKGLSPFL